MKNQLVMICDMGSEIAYKILEGKRQGKKESTWKTWVCMGGK
jgi:hypothetical protein